MNFFITGASGFIGKKLIKDLLLIKNNKIFALSQKKNKKVIKDRSSIKWIHGDLKSNLKRYLKKTDILMHLATKYDGNLSSEIYETNLLDSFSLFEQARKCGVKKYFVTGSGFEHGSSRKYITPLSILKPTTDYQISKSIFNIKICNWAKKYRLNLTYMKIFQVYGEGEKKNRLYPQIISCAKKNITLNLSRYSSNIIRDFIKLDDVIKDIIYQMNNNKGVNISNSCTGKKMSVLNFSKHIWKEFSNKKIKIRSILPVKPYPISNFGLRKINNIDNISYTFKKLKYE